MAKPTLLPQGKPIPLKQIAIWFLALLAIRIPFWIAQPLQEDAFITFRVAQNLLHSGTLGFNPHEPSGTATSPLYAALCAGVFAVGGAISMYAIVFLNTILLLFACLWIAQMLAGKGKNWLPIWVLLSLSAPALTISYMGMETAVLVFVLAYICRYAFTGVGDGRIAAAFAAISPFTRPELGAFLAVGIGLAMLKSRGSAQPSVKGMPLLAAIGVGYLAYFTFNTLYLGSAIPQTALAKEVAYKATLPTKVVTNLPKVLTMMSLAPIKFAFASSYLLWLGAIAAVVVAVRKRSSQETSGWETTVAILCVPMVLLYVVGPRVFEWYLHPATLLLYALILAVAWHSPVKIARYGMAAAVLIAIPVNLLCALKKAVNENEFRKEIGRGIRQMAKPSDSLFLEPAGYVPYEAGLYTYDYVGLTSPKCFGILKDSKGDRTVFWDELLKREHPTFILDRRNIAEQGAEIGGDKAKDPNSYFAQHYAFVKTFEFKPTSTGIGALDKLLAQANAVTPFYLYRRKDAAVVHRGN